MADPITQAPRLDSVERLADGSMRIIWTNNVPSGLQTYTGIYIDVRVGGTWVQVNSLGYPAISNQQYIQYSGPGGNPFAVGTAYEFALRATGPAGTSARSSSRTVAALETPTPTLGAVTRTGEKTARILLTPRHDSAAVTTYVNAWGRYNGTGPLRLLGSTSSGTQTTLDLTGLDGAASYSIELVAFGPAGSSDSSASRTLEAWWQAPTGVDNLVAFRDPATGDVTLTWEGTPPARAPWLTIEVHRAAGATGTFNRVATLPGTQRFYNDRTGADTTTYRYRVITRGPAGDVARDSSALAPTVLVPLPQTSVTATYTGTNQAQVTWQRQSTGDRPYTSQDVGWYDADAAVISPTWVAAGAAVSSATISLPANRRVRIVTRARNAAGYSDMSSPSGVVTTRPAGPASLSAGWSGGDIRVTWPTLTTIADRIRIEFTTDGATWFPAATLAPDARSWLHQSPSRTVPHTYRAWAEVDAAGVQDSPIVTSAAVPGLTKPAPPTVQRPEAIDAAEALLVPVLHNSLDGSEQTDGALRHRLGTSGAWATEPLGASASGVVPAGLYSNGDTIQVSAWTAGQSGEASDWSVPIAVTLRARPVPALTGPPALVTARTASTTWTATGQTSATVELLDGDGLMLESREVGAAARSVTWETPLEDESAYTTRLVMWDQWQPSLPVVRAFSVDIESPPDPELRVTFDPVAVTVIADVTAPGAERAEVRRLGRDGVWRLVGGGMAVTDPLPPLTVVSYRARVYNEAGGWSESEVVTVDATIRDCVLTLPDGTGLVRGGRVERAGQGRGRPTELVQLAGADRPTPFRARRLSAAALPVTVQLLPARNASTLDAWLDRLEHPGPLVYREPGGLLVAGTAVIDGWDPGDRFRASVSFTITETVDAPRIR